MKKQREKIEGKHISAIACVLAVAVTFLLPWAYLGPEKYTLYGFFRAIYAAGGIAAYAPDGGNIYASYVVTYLALAGVLLVAVHEVLLFFNIRSRILNTAMYGCTFIYFTGYTIFGGYDAGPALFAFVAIMGLEFLVVLYLEQSKEINENYRLMKKREREEKAERRRRLHFPGRYPREFYSVIWDNFKYKWKNYILFILSGVFSATFLTVAIGMNYILRKVHSIEDIVLGTGMQQILIRAVGLIMFLTIFLTAFVFSYYIKSRMSDYRMFTVLGIRSRTLSVIMMVEYAGSLLISFIAGIAAGTGILLYMRHLLVNKLGTGVIVSSIGPAIYLFALIGYVIVLMIATAINYESYLRVRDSFASVKDVAREKIPGRFLIPASLLGLEFIRSSISSYADTSIWTVFYFAFGLYLAITYGKALLMKWTDKSDRYFYRHLLEKIPFYYRFKKNCRYLVMLTTIHLLALGLFLIQFCGNLIAKPAEELIPYDFVLTMHEGDEDTVAGIEQKYDARADLYPMIRVTTPTGNSFDFMATLIMFAPPGQNIGISEATYRKLYEARGLPEPSPLGLEEDEIHIVFQQDSSYKVRPIDASAGAGIENPYLKLGQPQGGGEYAQWRVKDYECKILTGMLQRGSQENLVVFSDDYFNSAYAKTEEGIRNLCLLNVPEEHYADVDRELQTLREKHIVDESYDYDIRVYYGSRQTVRDIVSERYTNEVVYAFVILMLAACACFLTYIKFSFEAGDICRRYGFYDCMGMHEREQMKTIRKEMWPFAVAPVLISTVTAAIYTALVFRLRTYESSQIMNYIKTGGTMAAVYLIIQAAWMAWLVYQMERKIKKSRINVGRQEV
ncbi:ABC transporter permease [Dorea sp. D27]|uniref:ABC transporter permease n=1 Tax=Dorea sp. D27 TaxID=658665 RepID=UPI000673631C|nr:ABC transporter permease [Dorea sp. D27]KMZ55035.1 hypothetical protein HMPREF0980_00870 [Dorea sp. D27]